MSFSSEIKQIICKTEYECPKCRRAELAGFFVFPGRLSENCLRAGSTVEEVKRRIADGLRTEFGIATDTNRMNESDSDRLRAEFGCMHIKKDCCRLSYIRGAFLGSGSVSDPSKEYHLEFDTKNEREAVSFMSLLEKFGFHPKRTMRRGKYVVYIKESTQIADIIGYLSAGMAGLEFFSLQIERSVKGEIQRQVNCDSANLNKQARASSRQIKAIKKIKSARKWSSMPEVLREIGELRLEYPDISLVELGEKVGIGKSGVNHRLNRIMKYADELVSKEAEK